MKIVGVAGVPVRSRVCARACTCAAVARLIIIAARRILSASAARGRGGWGGLSLLVRETPRAGDVDEFIDATRRLELCGLGQPRFTFAFRKSAGLSRNNGRIARPGNRVMADLYSATTPRPDLYWCPSGARH